MTLSQHHSDARFQAKEFYGVDVPERMWAESYRWAEDALNRITTTNSILVKWRIDLRKEDRFMKETGSVHKLWCNNLDSIVGRKVFFSGFEDAKPI